MSQALCQKDKLKGPIKGNNPQPNGQMPQAAHSVSAVLQEAQTRAETWKETKPALWKHHERGAPKAPHAPKSSLPPPHPVRWSSDTSGSPAMPPKAKGTSSRGFPTPSNDFLPLPRLLQATTWGHQDTLYVPQEAQSINVHKRQMNKS
ncbi:amyloid beta A4 precursor protein-binding family B member 1-interacting protein-like [Callithrix jacchus]